tara:strand:- start:2478 stop:2912 length:435 start_codon:yes stop_codon:yes gene_type:complete
MGLMSWLSPTYKKGKEVLKAAEEANLKKMDKNVESIKKMTEGLSKKHLKLLKSKVGDVFGSSPGTISKWLKRLGIIGGAGGAGTYLGSRIEKAKQMGQDKEAIEKRSKGGYVKMKRGGSVKKSSSKKSRGIGAAKRGTKFKGVF